MNLFSFIAVRLYNLPPFKWFTGKNEWFSVSCLQILQFWRVKVSCVLFFDSLSTVENPYGSTKCFKTAFKSTFLLLNHLNWQLFVESITASEGRKREKTYVLTGKQLSVLRKFEELLLEAVYYYVIRVPSSTIDEQNPLIFSDVI